MLMFIVHPFKDIKRSYQKISINHPIIFFNIEEMQIYNPMFDTILFYHFCFQKDPSRQKNKFKKKNKI